MRKEKILRQFKNFDIHRHLNGKLLNCDWVAIAAFPMQILITFGGRCNRYFWDIRLKIYKLPNFYMLF